jgi:WD40 repeat protein
MPPDLGRVEVAFAANDLDDAHELRVTAPYLDLDIFAPGAAGPREIDLMSNEWAAVGHTARGGEIALAVSSLQSSAPATSRVATETLAIADTDPSALLVSSIFGGALPAMWRFDPQAGAATPLFANPPGACLGCHLAVSADGARIGAVMFVAGQTVNGVVLDASDGTVLAQSDPTSASPWITATFDPSGSLVGAYQGALSLRDGTTGVPMAAIATGEAASAPAISPDGTALAYVTLDEGMGNDASQPVGNALHVRPWNAATATVGAPIELVRDGGGVVLPVFSSDGRWIAFGHTANTEVPLSSSAVRSDGSGTSVMLTTDPLDQLAHWASPIAPARAGHRAAEPMVWIAFVSTRPIGGNATSLQQLWLEAFYPDRGVVMPAFHLPGQPATLQVLHGPLALH